MLGMNADAGSLVPVAMDECRWFEPAPAIKMPVHLANSHQPSFAMPTWNPPEEVKSPGATRARNLVCSMNLRVLRELCVDKEKIIG